MVARASPRPDGPLEEGQRGHPPGLAPLALGGLGAGGRRRQGPRGRRTAATTSTTTMAPPRTTQERGDVDVGEDGGGHEDEGEHEQDRRR